MNNWKNVFIGADGYKCIGSAIISNNGIRVEFNCIKFNNSIIELGKRITKDSVIEVAKINTYKFKFKFIMNDVVYGKVYDLIEK